MAAAAVTACVYATVSCAAEAPAVPASSASSAAPTESDWKALKQRVGELRKAGRLDEAVTAARQDIDMAEKIWGPRDLYVAASLVTLANTYMLKQDYAAAEPIYLQGLDIRLAQADPWNAGAADVLDDLGGLYSSEGQYARAEAQYRRSVAIQEKALGTLHPDVAATLNDLSAVVCLEGDFAGALALSTRSVAILEKVKEPEKAGLPDALNNLGNIYREIGDYAHAEPLYLRAAALQEKAFGPDDAGLAEILHNQGNLYSNKGDYARAEALYTRSLKILERSHGTRDPQLALALENLGNLHRDQGDYARAEALYLRSLDLRERVLGPAHPDVGQVLTALAELSMDEGDYARAEPLLLRSLGIREKALGAMHPEVAKSLEDLANLYRDKGDLAVARALYARSRAALEHAVGPMQPAVAETLTNEAMLEWRAQDFPTALHDLERSAEIEERNLAINLSAGSESQKRAYLGTMEASSDLAVSLHLDAMPADPAAARLALTTVLRRKGRLLDAMSNGMSAVRQHLRPQGQAMLDALASARARYFRLVMQGQQEQLSGRELAQLAELDDTQQSLEAKMSAEGAEFTAQTQRVALDQVQRALPPKSALVEWIAYRPFKPRAVAPDSRWGAPRYAAYVLRRTGQPVAVDLGDVASIDGMVEHLREALDDPDAPVAQSARELEERIMRPVRQRLGDTRDLLLSPDGALNLVPFAALVDEHGHYLAERYTIGYLSSGRDLLRGRTRSTARQRSVVIAAPDFDARQPAAAQEAAADPATREAVQLPSPPGAGFFEALPGANEEALAIQALLPAAGSLLTGAQASKAAVQQLHGPVVLHIATHGFFLEDHPDPVSSAAPATRRSAAQLEHWSAALKASRNPLLRSGLVFAGANSTPDAGILTAMEASGLDLWGTQLVVLSACDTGGGDVSAGDGVYGLRRSLTIAGAQSQVMSLWSADDESTRALMVDFYRRLMAGEGRAQALRHAQLAMLRAAGTRHPYYWANFIVAGDWGPISMASGTAERAVQAPGTRTTAGRQ